MEEKTTVIHLGELRGHRNAVEQHFNPEKNSQRRLKKLFGSARQYKRYRKEENRPLNQINEGE